MSKMKRVMLALLASVAVSTVATAQTTESEGGFFSSLWGGSSSQQERPIQNVVVPKLPAEADFAGERVPLE
ncbi:MAG: hypothetical protein J6R57_00870, partial [Bacteroidales bacterium]|nr:hypothetical protein [Bacteroidales bacterium]